MMYIYAYHTYIIPHIYIYIYATVPWIFEKHNIPLVNNVVALYAILPLGEFWITILLWKSTIDHM